MKLNGLVPVGEVSKTKLRKFHRKLGPKALYSRTYDIPSRASRFKLRSIAHPLCGASEDLRHVRKYSLDLRIGSTNHASRNCFIMQWHKIITVFLSSVVEFLCSLFFVLIGCGSTISWPQEEANPNVLSISLCFGFSCAFLVNISTYFSGGFFNPAITIALAANKTLSAKRALCYVVAQLIGGKNF